MVKTVVDNFIELSLEDKTKEGDTPLMLAVLANNIEIAKYLLDSGSNINARENEGSTPLLAAAANGFVDLLIFLIDSGANIDSRNF
jgi:ankyrin repeat protein